jgi:hypothetical protein
MLFLAKRYIKMLDQLELKMDGIYSTVKKIYDHRTSEHKDKLHNLYHNFETEEKYFEFVGRIEKRYCDELIEFIILRGIFDLYKGYFGEGVKLMFFNKLADTYIKIDSDKEIAADVKQKRKFCKLLEADTKHIQKLEKYFHTMYQECLMLINFHLIF